MNEVLSLHGTLPGVADDPIRSDLRALRVDLRSDLKEIRDDVKVIGEKLTEHTLDDADREAKVLTELGTVRTKLSSLESETDDKHKFMRGWIGGLIALAIAAGIGFLFNRALEPPRAVPAPAPAMQP